MATTTITNLEITGNLFYQGQMLTICGQSTSTPCYTSSFTEPVVFGLGIIIVILSLMFLGFIFNHLNKK